MDGFQQSLMEALKSNSGMDIKEATYLLCHDFDFAVENRFPITNYMIVPDLGDWYGDGVRQYFDLESISKSAKNMIEGD